MPDFLIIRKVTCSAVIEADSPDEALDIAACMPMHEFEDTDWTEEIDPDYGDFVKFMKDNKEKF